MATSSFNLGTANDITGALATLFEDDIVALWNRAVVLTKLLPVVPANSQNIVWDLKDSDGSDTPANSAIAEGADVSTYNDDPIEKAVLGYTNYSEAFSITGMAISAARATGNPAALADLFGEKMMDAVTRLAKNLNSEWYTGTGATGRIAGLVDATNGALKATGTYAGISKASKPLFAGNEMLNGGSARPLSIGLMREMMRQIYVASGEYPDCIVTDPVQWARYGMLMQDQRRFVQEVRTAAGPIKFDGGFQALDFDGIPIVQDKDCPAGKMLFINSRHVRVRQLTDALLPAPLPGSTGSGGSVRLSGTTETYFGGGPTGLVARINPLAVTGDAYKFQLLLYPQLQVRRPNACGLLGDLVTTIAL